MWLLLTECFEKRMVSSLLVEQRVISGLIASKMVILTLKTGVVVDEGNFSKIQNWRHYLIKTGIKARTNWKDQWE